MKIRTGFVSNSSSTSFMCEVCKLEVEGYNGSLSGAMMGECLNRHTICIDHISEVILTDDQMIEVLKKVQYGGYQHHPSEDISIEDDYKECMAMDDSIHNLGCPICIESAGDK